MLVSIIYYIIIYYISFHILAAVNVYSLNTFKSGFNQISPNNDSVCKQNSNNKKMVKSIRYHFLLYHKTIKNFYLNTGKKCKIHFFTYFLYSQRRREVSNGNGIEFVWCYVLINLTYVWNSVSDKQLCRPYQSLSHIPHHLPHHPNNS